ncbi:helix-turn-helix transcriptional regulator [Pseudoruegeria sp. SK021]|uniref:helix-turn-helix transcriptional regulator n=1 Tax=Pseudoruegeria sp. SK021 TaxID=1933035 RepID=UPI000A263B88|nr:helix-turn-helix transcriptional regulator [Pseudoruegeria sp. SK021]OSP53952.1 hypothetical protein BV911_15265 [Pseudoruegeria sp. SK021]
MSGSVSLDLVAAELGTSPRTLQRRLAEQGLRFWKIVDDTRLSIAGALLRETELSVQQISDRVGYSTPGGFARAFGRWAGMSPTTFRNVSAPGRTDWREMGRPDAHLEIVQHQPKTSRLES